MNDKLNQTMKILRSSKVTTDSRGRTVWVDPVETAKLELVSTQMLKQIIDGSDVDAQENLRQVADGEEGLLARDVDKGRFEVISDTELQRILDGTDQDSAPGGTTGLGEEPVAEVDTVDEELELVSTQMLRTILSPEDDGPDDDEVEVDSGFNPYDSV